MTNFAAECNASGIHFEQRLGEHLKVLRTSRALTIRTIAEQTGLSPGMISQVESGQVSASLRTIRALAQAYDVTLDSLFAGESEPVSNQSGIVARPGTRRILNLENLGMTIEIAAPAEHKSMQASIATILPGGGSGPECDTHRGEETGLVLNGFLDLYLDEEKHSLCEGDSFCFNAKTPHRFVNPGKQVTRVYWVTTEPIWLG